MVIKRLFDVAFSIFLLSIIIWPLILVMAAAGINTRSSGLFLQDRVGQYGKLFKILKLRTMHAFTKDISPFGAFLRKYKIDEVPQLINILKGDMSFVGPRPDVAGYYDELKGDERKMLLLKPGLTSMAAIKYRNEESLLAVSQDPLDYNERVVFPDKVALNYQYYRERSFILDLKIIFRTVFSLFN